MWKNPRNKPDVSLTRRRITNNEHKTAAAALDRERVGKKNPKDV
jgi:hypothetical protein